MAQKIYSPSCPARRRAARRPGPPPLRGCPRSRAGGRRAGRCAPAPAARATGRPPGRSRRSDRRAACGCGCTSWQTSMVRSTMARVSFSSCTAGERDVEIDRLAVHHRHEGHVDARLGEAGERHLRPLGGVVDPLNGDAVGEDGVGALLEVARATGRRSPSRSRCRPGRCRRRWRPPRRRPRCTPAPRRRRCRRPGRRRAPAAACGVSAPRRAPRRWAR